MKSAVEEGRGEGDMIASFEGDAVLTILRT